MYEPSYSFIPFEHFKLVTMSLIQSDTNPLFQTHEESPAAKTF